MTRLTAVCAALFLIVVFPLWSWAATGTLTWTANTEADLAGYKIYQSTVQGDYTTPPFNLPLVTLGKVTTYTVTIPDSSMDQRWYFTITAYDLAGNESPKSTEVNKLIPAVPVAQKPGTPVLIVSARTTTTLTVTYAPVPDGVGGIATVAIRYAPTPISWGSAPEAPCPASPCTITGLTADTSYDLQAVAYRGTPNVNAVFGPLSAVVTIKTMPLDLPPAPPGGLQISSATPDQIVIVASATECVRVLTSTTGSTAAVRKRTVTCVR